MDHKAMARAYHTAVSDYDEAAVTRMVREDYIQHNPRVPTGRAAFVSFLPKLKEHQTRIVNIRMLSDVSHIVMHHVWKNAAPFGGREMAAFHVIRFDGAGLIAEHWSVMTELMSPNRSGRTLVDGPTAIHDLERTEGNRAIVSELFRGLAEASPERMADIMASFSHPEFHQHHPSVGDGITGYRAAVTSGQLRLRYTKQHRVFGEGNFVLSISEGVLGGMPTAFYDLFRLEAGRIAEHWSIYQEIPTQGLANDNTMFNF